MPRGKIGFWSRYRNARKDLTDFEAQREKRQRTRPRTRGKKAAKTRALNQLARKIAAAKGRLTKARNAIARDAAQRKGAKSAVKQKRSSAAKKGWAKRKGTARTASPSATTHAISHGGRPMRFLEERDGVVVQIAVAPPDRADRSTIGSYWYAVGVFRDNGSTALLLRFENRTIYDSLRQERLLFVTDPALLLEAIAAGQTDFDDLYIESTWSSAA